MKKTASHHARRASGKAEAAGGELARELEHAWSNAAEWADQTDQIERLDALVEAFRLDVARFAEES